MKTAQTKAQLRELLDSDRKVGFIPTMGALHDGHLSLIAESHRRGLLTVVSIFVNPTQFNDPGDYKKYPVDIETDLKKLVPSGCDIVFIPSRSEVYDKSLELSKYIHNFGDLEKRLEGAFRPGHFKGVGQVVHILFDIVKPDVAFFGEKDFQQLQVIKYLVEKTQMKVEIVGMPTVRENDGLAMSSRNMRLGHHERKQSVVLHEALLYAKTQWMNQSLAEIKKNVTARFDRADAMSLEYFDIIDPDTFTSIEAPSDDVMAHAVIAAFAGDVRLIDNMRLV